MNKSYLNAAVDNCKGETKAALQIVYDTLNNGQQKQLLKNEKVKVLFELYEVTL